MAEQVLHACRAGAKQQAWAEQICRKTAVANPEACENETRAACWYSNCCKAELV
jgi:hypothetical protein